MERRSSRIVVGIVSTVALAMCAIAAGLSVIPDAAASPAASAQPGDSGVSVEVELGIEGIVPVSPTLPVHVEVSSKRARRLTLELSWDSGMRSLDFEVGANASTTLDLSVPRSTFLEVSINDLSHNTLANKSLGIQTDPGRTIVAIGKSLASQGAPRSAPTIGAIQEARLVPLTPELLDRPGVMETVSGVVLAAGDIDSLDEATRDALREWVWSGGDLALDLPAREQLPIVDLPADGPTTAVGSGWVRFTEGAAAAGSWSTVLEPSTIRTRAVFDANFNNFGFNNAGVPAGMLLNISFISTWNLVLAVFGTALVAGPVCYYAFRTRHRRRLMWFSAPGISVAVAALLLVSGQGVFADSTTKLVAGANSSAWTSTGAVFAGLKESTTLQLDGRTELISARPDAVIDSSGSGRSVRIPLTRNSFGTVGIGPATFDGNPRIEVKAFATEDGTATVSVTNHTKGSLTGVTIAGNSRVRGFVDVAPGATQTLNFKMASDMWTFGEMFPDEDATQFGVGELAKPRLNAVRESRGLVSIRGTLEMPVSVNGLSGDAMVDIGAIVPVRLSAEHTPEIAPGSPAESAALRIDELGGLSNEQLAQDGEFGFDERFAPTTVDGEGVGDGTGTGAPQGPEYVRFTFPRGRTAALCGVHTSAPALDYWNGTSWTPLERSGQPYPSEQFKDVMGNPSEMQGWVFPAVSPGGRLHLRISGRTAFNPPALLFDCGARP